MSLYQKACDFLDRLDDRINTYAFNKKYAKVMRVHELGNYAVDTPQFDLWGRFVAVGTYGDCVLYCKLKDKGYSFDEIYEKLVEQNPRLKRTDMLFDLYKTLI